MGQTLKCRVSFAKINTEGYFTRLEEGAIDHLFREFDIEANDLKIDRSLRSITFKSSSLDGKLICRDTYMELETEHSNVDYLLHKKKYHKKFSGWVQDFFYISPE